MGTAFHHPIRWFVRNQRLAVGKLIIFLLVKTPSLISWGTYSILSSNLQKKTTLGIKSKIPDSEVESRVGFMQVTKCGQIFLRPDMSSHAAENSGQIQPQVVFCCKHNIIMRIYIKIQLVVEFRLGFLRVYQRHPNTSETRSTARGSHGYDVSSFNVLVYWIVNHDKFNPRLYFRSVLCG